MPDFEESDKQRALKAKRADARSLSVRAERSLKDVDRLLDKHPDTPAYERVMAQLEQAKVAALLELAEAIRETRRAGGPPSA